MHGRTKRKDPFVLVICFFLGLFLLANGILSEPIVIGFYELNSTLSFFGGVFLAIFLFELKS